jgi:hypothetical protein
MISILGTRVAVPITSINKKILTYMNQNRSFLSGGETLIMDNSGNYFKVNGTVRCIFSGPIEVMVPAFCNIVQAKSDLININHAKISIIGEIRLVGGFSTPAGMNYQITVTPDGTSGLAEGTVKTEFTSSIMEARNVNMSEDT